MVWELWSGLDPLLGPRLGILQLFGNMGMTLLGAVIQKLSFVVCIFIHLAIKSLMYLNPFIFLGLCSFIEWMGCCCRGSCGENTELVKLKDEMGEQYHLAPICRDTHFQHPVRTKACEALAQLPFAMSLYSGYLSLSF